MSFITFKKYMILKNLSLIKSCNFSFNLTNFLKLRIFLEHGFVLLNRRPQNHKNKNVEQKLLDTLSIKCYSSSNPRPIKNHSNFIRYQNCTGNQKKGHISLGDQQDYYSEE